MGGKVGPTMQESVHKWRTQPRHLPEDAPNILIVMLDDAGFGQPDTFGGEIHTPTMSRLAEAGIAYNAFHTTAMCSPTRAALMTGRNHNRVGFGQIAELANDWDGYTGIIPKSSATIAEVLGPAGYRTYMSGKWHVTPYRGNTTDPDKSNWPLQRGFDRFYGTITGAGSFFDPGTLTRGNQYVSPFADPEYPPSKMANGEFYYTDAIAEHYSPLGPNDRCPGAPVSVAVALADKIDTLVGLFAVGAKPTGSKDPYALRRAALGVIRIVLENGVRLPLLKEFRAHLPGNESKKEP